MMLSPTLDPNGQMPLYEQLYRYVRLQIERGELLASEKLPSKRKLSAHLKISQTTVESAYAQLVAEGYVKAVPKSGYYVQRLEVHTLPVKNPLPPVVWSKETHAYELDCKTNVVDTTLFPFATWTKIARQVLRERGDELLNTSCAQGLYLFRQEIARHLRAFRGIEAAPEQIVVGAGSSDLIGVLIQILGRENVYAIENPGYYKISRILANHDVTSVAVPLDEQGLQVEALRISGANIVYMTPSHQFPSGIVMPATRRTALLNWANESSDRYLIEADYDSEFRFLGQPIQALQTLDQIEKVIYINSFTKSLAPGLRISYLVLPPHLLTIYQEKFYYYECKVPNLEQYILHSFMKEELFERHLNRMRKSYKEKRDAFIRIVRKEGMKDINIIGHDAGLHFLMQHRYLSEDELIERAKDQGVRVYGISEYCFSAVPQIFENTVVVGYAGLNTQQVCEAASRLCNAWRTTT